jgi:hypothetical protein
MRRASRKNWIGEQFAPRTIRMLRSPAYCVLSLSARRVLDRIEIEMADHGGTDNGKLPVTYDDFEQYGIHRHAIGPAIREVVALGFIEITEHGRAGNAEWRKPNLFRLTYRQTKYEPTNDWEKIKTPEEAEALAKAARVPRMSNKNKTQWRKTPVFGDGKHHHTGKFQGTENTTTSDGAETTTTLDISGGRSSSAERPSGWCTKWSRKHAAGGQVKKYRERSEQVGSAACPGGAVSPDTAARLQEQHVAPELTSPEEHHGHDQDRPRNA